MNLIFDKIGCLKGTKFKDLLKKIWNFKKIFGKRLSKICGNIVRFNKFFHISSSSSLSFIEIIKTIKKLHYFKIHSRPIWKYNKDPHFETISLSTFKFQLLFPSFKPTVHHLVLLLLYFCWSFGCLFSCFCGLWKLQFLFCAESECELLLLLLVSKVKLRTNQRICE